MTISKITNLLEHSTAKQLFRYIIVGASGTLIYIVIFTLMNETVLSAANSLTEAERVLNYSIANSLAFFVSSIFVYIYNRNWVFKADRHKRHIEIGLFYLIALLAYGLSTAIGAYVMMINGSSEYFSLIITIIASVMINFIGRKKIVFHN